MKNIIILVCLFLAYSINGYAQSIGSRWAELFSDNEKSVFMDTTSIRVIDNQLTVWCQVVNSKPIKKDDIDEPIKKIKTQYLINTLTERYSVIGALYYDTRGRIVGESSRNLFAGGGSASSTSPVSENDLVGALADAAKNYHENQSLGFDEYKYDLSDETNLDDTVEEDNTDQYTNNDTTNESEDDYDPYSDETDNTSEVNDNNSMNDTSTDVPTYEEETSNVNRNYNDANERVARGTIYTDGNLYCFQLSSWRNKSKAENEVRKLKNRGHNAFLVQAYIPKKGGTWFRVRIGYFNTLEEARNYQRRM